MLRASTTTCDTKEMNMQQVSSPRPGRRSRRQTARRALGAVLLAAVLGGLAAGVTVPQRADAWSWDPHVVLNGKIGCTYSLANTVQWAWVSASDGEAGWAWL